MVSRDLLQLPQKEAAGSQVWLMPSVRELRQQIEASRESTKGMGMIRFWPVFAAAVAAAFAAGLSVRIRAPYSVAAYLMLECTALLATWWLLCRHGVFESRFYAVFFYAVMALVSLLRIGISVTWPINLLAAAFLFPSLTMTLGLCVLRLRSAYPMEAAQSAVFLFCGILTLLALAEPLSPVMWRAALALGLLWTLQGVFGWVHALSNAPIVGKLNLFIPPMLCLMAFSWLAVAYSGAQPELATQHVSDQPVLSEMQHLEAR